MKPTVHICESNTVNNMKLMILEKIRVICTCSSSPRTASVCQGTKSTQCTNNDTPDRQYVSAQTCNLPLLEMGPQFPVLAPITSTVLFWIPFKEIFHLVRYPNSQSVITGTGRDSFCTISGTLQCHFRYGNSLGPVPKLGSMRVVPFPVRGSASSGTVIHWAPYRNWALYAWSLFRYGTLPVPVWSFSGSRTETGLYARWVRPPVGLWVCGFVVSVRTF